MAEPFFNNIQILMIGGGIAMIIAILMILKKSKRTAFKEYIPLLFKDTVVKEINDKLKLYGKKIKKGKIIIGFDVIAHIDRYYSTKGKSPIAIFDEDKGNFQFLEDENKKGEIKSVKYDFTIFRLKNKFFLLRWFGLKKYYMIVRNEDDKKNTIVRFDSKTNRFFLPKGIEFDSYGGIWNESPIAKEYLNNISFLDMLQQMQTHLQNIPNRTVHLEVEQAKKERLFKTLAEIEKGKYDKMKTGDETVIS